MAIHSVTDDASVLDFEVVINGKRHRWNLRDELLVDASTLQQEMMKQPGKYAWFATICELAKRDAAMAKAEFKRVQARLYAEFRAEKDAEGKKLTENLIEGKMLDDPRYIAAEKRFTEADQKADLLNVARESFSQRKDMLISLSSSLRGQQDTQVNDLKKAASETIKKSREGKTRR